VKTSTIDVNADPIYPPVGKPVSQIDIDADLAESTKPWRLPGADQSDYFNYGFDEFTWEMYRQRQDNMASTLANQKAETAQFQQMFMPGMPQPGGGGGGAGGSGGQAGGLQGVPAGPSAGAGMPGMPGMSEEQMQMMMAQMQASGMDMGNMDFNTFMQMAGGMGGGFPTGPQQGQQQQGYGGGGQPGGGGRGGGRRGGRGGW
jgi:pre-mRNA 3'-end-processing factor FIP1